MTPWLSVLVPVYNVEKYLAECLASVLEQCDTGVEVIVLDDQSTDGSFTLLQELQNSSRVSFKILQHEVNKGLSGARNTLLRAATGTYIWFLDSDDILVSGAVAHLAEILNTESPDVVICDHEIWHCEHGNLVARPNKYVRGFVGVARKLSADPIALFSGIYRSAKLHSWSKISKRELWGDDLFFPEGQYFEDMVVTPLLALRAKNFHYVPEAWIWYRQRDGSILKQSSKKKVDDMAAGVNGVLAAWLKAYPKMPFGARMAFIRFSVKIYFFTRKELKKIGQTDGETLSYYRVLLLKNIHCSKRQLIIYYIRNGDFFRLPRLLRYL